MMLQPPKDKKVVKEQKIIGETAPDKSISETEPVKEEKKKEDIEEEQITNRDNKITNDDASEEEEIL